MITLHPHINIRDDFRRDGLAASFLVDRELYAIYASAYPAHTRFNIGYPSICDAEYRMCKRILDVSNEGQELCLVSHARESDLNIMASLLTHRQHVSANVWIPASTAAARNILRLDPARVLALAKQAIRYWKRKSCHPLDIAFTDVTCGEAGIETRVINWYDELRSLGYRSVILCDTKGMGEEGQLRSIFEKINEFEWHPHNDKNNALLTSQIASAYSVTHIGASYLAFSERRNMLDPRQLIEDRMNLETLKVFHREFEKLIGDPIAIRNEIYSDDVAITGTHFKLWNFLFGKRLHLGVTSDCYIASAMAGRTVTPEELSALKDEALYKQRVLFLTQKQLKNAIHASACMSDKSSV